MATKTKEPQAPRRTAQDIVAEQGDKQMERIATEAELVEKLEMEQDDVIQPGTLRMSVSQARVLADMGCGNPHRVCELLKRQRGTRQLREEAGDPRKVKQARADAADAAKAEAKAAAELDEQIAALQQKRTALRAATEAAERRADELERKRDTLRKRAPKFLLDHVSREIAAAKHGNPIRDRENKLSSKFHSLKSFVEQFRTRGQRGDRDPVLVNYAKVYLPAAVKKDDGGFVVSMPDVTKHYEWLRGEGLAAVQKEWDEVRAEWKDFVAQIESTLLDGWAERGAEALFN